LTSMGLQNKGQPLGSQLFCVPTRRLQNIATNAAEQNTHE